MYNGIRIHLDEPALPLENLVDWCGTRLHLLKHNYIELYARSFRLREFFEKAGDFGYLKSRIRLFLLCGSEGLDERLNTVRDSIGDFISIGINHLTLQLRASELLAFERSACAKEILNLFGSVEISIVVDDDFALGGDLFASDMLNERNTTIYFEPDVERERFGWFADQQHIMPGTDIKVSELRRMISIRCLTLWCLRVRKIAMRRAAIARHRARR